MESPVQDPTQKPPQDGPALDHDFFATVARGTEEVLAEELVELGAYEVERVHGGVHFAGSLADGYRVCVGSRIASRILLPLDRFEAQDASSLYEGVARTSWTDHLGPETTFAVDVAGTGSAGPGKFVALKTKDAIVDVIRSAEGTRPSIDKVDPGLRIHVHLSGTQVTISLDLVGRGLHRRGVGRSGGAAPLKESLAAALLRMAGWHQRTGDELVLIDPMCGSGTFLIEAAWMARDVAPGLRRGFGAPGWRAHDADAFAQVIAAAEERKAAGADRPVVLVGVDSSEEQLGHARENLAAAGVSGVELRRGTLTDLEAPAGPPGLFVVNPPYGERLGEAGELGPLYAQLGDVLKHRFPGWSAWVLSGNQALAKRIGLRPASRRVVMNGPIECRWLEIPIGERAKSGGDGPGWRKASAEAEMFENRLRKNHKRLSRWALKNETSAYRLYDADIPEFNVAVDVYGDDLVRVEEYRRPKKVEEALADRRLRDVMLVVPKVLGLRPEEVVLRVRGRGGDKPQEERRGDLGLRHPVYEGQETFLVNLRDYLDTGLFLDDRELRRRIRSTVGDGRFLNLFSHTAAASVSAASGGARSTTSVDLSRRYLDWGQENFRANDISLARHEFIKADALRWLQDAGKGHERWDLILLAPPTYSRSKGMEGEFDVQRDHVRVITDAMALLVKGGEVLFTTNLRTFALEASALQALGLHAEEITADLTPEDFRKKPRVQAWSIKHA